MYVYVMPPSGYTSRTDSTITPEPCTDYYAQSIWKFENNGTDTKGNNNVTLEGGATYSTTTPAEGTRYANLDGASRYIAIPSFDYGNEFTISIFVRKWGTGSTYDVLYSAYQSSDGFILYANWTSLASARLILRTGNGTDITTTTSSAFSVTSGAWTMYSVVVNRTNGTVVFYNNKTEISSGAIRTDFETSTAARIGLDFNGNGGVWAYIDVTQVYKWELNSTNIGTIYDTPGAEATTCK